MDTIDRNSPQKDLKPRQTQRKTLLNNGKMLYPCRYCNKVFPSKKNREVHMDACPPPPLKKPPPKIDIQQNIVLNKQINIDDILSKTKLPRLSQGNSIILKEKNGGKSAAIFATSPMERGEKQEASVCSKCNEEFDNQLELLRHSRKCNSYPKIVMALSEVEKFYSVKDRSECPICHKPLKTIFRSAFIKHLHIHTNDMKHTCDVCNKKFRRVDHMKAHAKRHGQ